MKLCNYRLLRPANKNLATNNGNNALYAASEQGHVEVARRLLDAGADKNVAANNGNTSLIAASSLAHLEVVRLLLDAAADADLGSNDGTTALMASSQQAHVESVGLPRAAVADETSTNCQQTQLWKRAEPKHLEKAKVSLCKY